MVALNNLLVRGYTHERRNKQPPSVYLADFKNGVKRMRYLAAEHERAGKRNPTIPLIKMAFEQEKPDFVIIERPSTTNSNNGKIAAPAGQDEAEYAAYLAQQHGVPFMGAEPNDADFFKGMLAKGYSERDVMGLYLLRVIPSGEKTTRESAPIPFQSEEQLEKFANHYFSAHACFDSISPEKRLTYKTFKQWYDEKNQGAIQRPIWQFSSEDAAPFDEPKVNYFQRLNHFAGLVREEAINKTIQAALQKHNNVMVVYGGGHLVQSLPVYEKALGKPTYITGNSVSDATSLPAASTLQRVGQVLNKPSFACFALTAASVVAGVVFPAFWIPAAITAAGAFAMGAYSKQQEDLSAQPQLATQERAVQTTRASSTSLAMASGINYRNNHTAEYLSSKGAQRERSF